MAHEWVSIINLLIWLLIHIMARFHRQGLDQWYSNLARKIHYPEEFSYNPDQTPPACDFLIILKTLISMLRCVWLGLELKLEWI